MRLSSSHIFVYVLKKVGLITLKFPCTSVRIGWGEEQSPKKTISASGGLVLLQMVGDVVFLKVI